jgi:tetratricopeptide (TPR) repeat protein
MSGEDDLLERATRALRAAPPPSDEELRIERAVLLRAHRTAAQKKSKSRALRWVLPLAAVLTAGSALAATTGQIERAVAVVSEWLGKEPTEQPRRAKHVRSREEAVRSARPLPAPTPAPIVIPPEPALEPQPAPTLSPTPAPTPAPRRAAPKPAHDKSERSTAVAAEAPAEEPPAAEPVAPEPAANPDLIRYREAHRLHFRERDFWAALRAWESYLSTYPEGTFAIEARYNRAICLVRLGRKDEAKRALAPFASGEVARGYRKTEASELLKALE